MQRCLLPSGNDLAGKLLAPKKWALGARRSAPGARLGKLLWALGSYFLFDSRALDWRELFCLTLSFGSKT